MRFPPLPADTARAAELAFGRDHLYLKIGRQLDAILVNFELPVLIKDDAFLGEIFWPYSLAAILQYWEDLTDYQMVNASRNRLDLKYALHLPLDFPGFKPLALCAFRQNVLINGAIKEAFRELINHLSEFADNQKKHLADPEGIIDTLCLLSRAEIITETIGNALEALAVYCPNWLLSNTLPHWYKLYYQKPGPQQIPRDPEKIESLIQTLGKDGQHLLEAIAKTGLPDCRVLPEVQNLQNEWKRQYEYKNGNLGLRSMNCIRCSDRVGTA